VTLAHPKRPPATPPLAGTLLLCLAAALGCMDKHPDSKAAASSSDSTTVAADAGAAADSATVARTPSLDQLSRLASQRWRFDLDSLVARRVIRVLVSPNRMAYFLDGPRQRGSAYEAVHAFEGELNRTLGNKTLQVECVFIPVPRDQLLSRLADGRGDLAVGLIQPTPERRKQLDFSAPFYEGVREIVVTGPGAPAIQRLDDLGGQEVYVRPSSSSAENLRRLNQERRARGQPEIVIRPADEHLDDGDILEMVSTGIVPITVVSDGDAEAYAPLLPGLTVHRDLEVASGGSYAWALRKNTPQLREAVDRFVRGHRSGTTFGNIMIQRYWRDNRWLKNPTAGGGLARYQTVIGAFRVSAAEFDLDPLLLLAQGYQESGLDQSRVSHAGAVGVMQIKPSTAAAPPIGIKDVDRLESNVRAGAKYLRFIIDRYYSDSTITPLDRELFAMASYNAGPARVAGLRRKAREADLDPDRWFQNVEVIAAREIGRETVDYVSNIYKYYLAYTLLAEHRVARERAESAARTPDAK
jgi:membrane-bound lytic murein transglycosylase MltF